MEQRQLEVFVAVARHRSFTRAAGELHLVQSAVSSNIAALEQDVGQRLFDRTTRRVELTAAGEVLLDHARDVLAAVQSARDAVDAVRGELGGSLRIGYMTNVRLFDIPHLLGRFRADHPAVRMHLAPSATGTAGLAAALRSGDLDIAFLSATPAEHPDLQVDVLARSRLGLTVAAGSPLARRRRWRRAPSAGMAFIDLLEGFGTRTSIDNAFRAHGLLREVHIETSDIIDTASLVRNGLGVAFLPEYMAAGDDTLHWIAVSDVEMGLSVSVATAKARTPSAAATRLADLARSVGARPGQGTRTIRNRA